MNFRMRRIVLYALGSLVVSLWAVFHILDYFLAMLIVSVLFSFTLVVEAEYARLHHEDKKHHRKMFFALLIILLCTILIIFEYS